MITNIAPLTSALKNVLITSDVHFYIDDFHGKFMEISINDPKHIVEQMKFYNKVSQINNKINLQYETGI
jgi:hypothetical protein